ncbi:hypothetical protein VTP01DRAFT_4882 [Rhizomucor pusillus]|uniref:uncharacterized protein n=1 Tax=Rhizomucor pusillus TaxID=4840 RepID=UPI0037435F24
MSNVRPIRYLIDFVNTVDLKKDYLRASKKTKEAIPTLHEDGSADRFHDIFSTTRSIEIQVFKVTIPAWLRLHAKRAAGQPDLNLSKNGVEAGLAECGKDDTSEIRKKEIVKTQLHCPKVFKNMFLRAVARGGNGICFVRPAANCRVQPNTAAIPYHGKTQLDDKDGYFQTGEVASQRLSRQHLRLDLESISRTNSVRIIRCKVLPYLYWSDLESALAFVASAGAANAIADNLSHDL